MICPYDSSYSYSVCSQTTLAQDYIGTAQHGALGLLFSPVNLMHNWSLSTYSKPLTLRKLVKDHF